MSSAVVATLKPHSRNLGSLTVKRLLPGHPFKMVGPFIFLDHMGPVSFRPKNGVDIAPHPHIGLATVTYLFEGTIVHRDSLGTLQRIAPGDVNWMTAGRGIVHSERSAPEDRASGQRVHGIQTWVALPRSFEQTEPSFSHHPKATLPFITRPGVQMRVIAGTAYGERAPVPTFSETLYVAVEMAGGSAFTLPPDHAERGVYAVEGAVGITGATLAPQHLAVLSPGETVEIRAAGPARLMLVGGEKMDGDRFIWWNFVASSMALIEEAKIRWGEQRFPRVPGETEFIPLPIR